jgi:hypothetical protein
MVMLEDDIEAGEEERRQQEPEAATFTPTPTLEDRRRVVNDVEILRVRPKLRKSAGTLVFFEKHSINTDTHTRMSTHPYEYTNTHPILMSTSERLRRFDLKIHEVGHQECLAVNGNVASH